MEISAGDRTTLLQQGIVVVRARRVRGRPRVEVTGGDEDRVRGVVAATLGAEADVDVIGVYPRRLERSACVGYREREPGRLALWFHVRGDQHVGDVILAEDDETVVVLGLVCSPVVDDEGDWRDDHVHVSLERPLGERIVLDGCGGKLVPFFPGVDGGG